MLKTVIYFGAGLAALGEETTYTVDCVVPTDLDPPGAGWIPCPFQEEALMSPTVPPRLHCGVSHPCLAATSDHDLCGHCGTVKEDGDDGDSVLVLFAWELPTPSPPGTFHIEILGPLDDETGTTCSVFPSTTVTLSSHKPFDECVTDWLGGGAEGGVVCSTKSLPGPGSGLVDTDCGDEATPCQALIVGTVEGVSGGECGTVTYDDEPPTVIHVKYVQAADPRPEPITKNPVEGIYILRDECPNGDVTEVSTSASCDVVTCGMSPPSDTQQCLVPLGALNCVEDGSCTAAVRGLRPDGYEGTWPYCGECGVIEWEGQEIKVMYVAESPSEEGIYVVSQKDCPGATQEVVDCPTPTSHPLSTSTEEEGGEGGGDGGSASSMVLALAATIAYSIL